MAKVSFLAWCGASALAVCGGALHAQQSGVPDAPTPQPPPLSTLTQGMKPGAAAPEDSQAAQPPANGNITPPGSQPVNGQAAAGDDEYQNAPILGEPGKDLAQISKPIRISTNFVIVPVTVRDKNHQLIAGLTWRDFQVYEDNKRMRLSFFSSDAIPMSVALVVDQALDKTQMQTVNQALAAIPGAFAAYDEVSVFTYANGAEQQTEYTAALGDRLPAVLRKSAGTGRDIGPPITGGPLASGPTINGQPFDPNLEPVRNGGQTPVIPREIYTLNDAIFAAAQSLASRERERRRIIYVISDGKEHGSKLSQKEVIRYLLTNNIEVSGTVIGDSAMPVIGYLDKMRIPLLPKNNILPRYADATGGTLDSELSRDGIEKSFARVTEAARTAYTLGYNSPTPVTDPAWRHIEVRVNRPDVTIHAKDGYYPTAIQQK